jgi:hypothetical protein
MFNIRDVHIYLQKSPVGYRRFLKIDFAYWGTMNVQILAKFF